MPCNDLLCGIEIGSLFLLLLLHLIHYTDSLPHVAGSPSHAVAGQCLGSDAGQQISLRELGRVQAAAAQLSATPTQEEFDQKLAALPPVVYKICPNTTIIVGFPAGVDPNSPLPAFDPPGSVPIYIVTPNVTVQCGDEGKVQDNCVLNHGPASISSIPSFPPLGPFQFNTDNLLIQGFTLSGYLLGASANSTSTTNKPSCENQDGRLFAGALGVTDRHAIGLSAAGKNVTVKNILVDGLEGAMVVLGSDLDVTGTRVPPSTNGANVRIKNVLIRNSVSYTGFFRTRFANLKITKTVVKNSAGCDVQGLRRIEEGVFLVCEGKGAKCTWRNVCISDSTFLSALVNTNDSIDSVTREPLGLPRPIVSRKVSVQNVDIEKQVTPGNETEIPKCEAGILEFETIQPPPNPIVNFDCIPLEGVQNKECGFSLGFA